MQRGAGRSERQSKSQGGMSKSQGGMRHRKQAGESIGMAETTGWSSALDPEFTKKGRVKKQKKSGRNQAEERTFETDVDNGAAGSELSPHRWLKVPSEPTPALGPRQLQPAGAAFNMHKLSESLFVSWEELLGQREALKRRIDTIAAVHGWQGASAQQCFLGGVEPSALLDSIQAEIVAMEPAAEALEAADVLLQLQACREQCMIVGEERDRLAEDLQQSQEESFQVIDSFP